jgi:hypothetical protein
MSEVAVALAAGVVPGTGVPMVGVATKGWPPDAMAVWVANSLTIAIGSSVAPPPAACGPWTPLVGVATGAEDAERLQAERINTAANDNSRIKNIFLDILSSRYGSFTEF